MQEAGNKIQEARGNETWQLERQQVSTRRTEKEARPVQCKKGRKRKLDRKGGPRKRGKCKKQETRSKTGPSCRFRKQRWALGAVGGRPGPSSGPCLTVAKAPFVSLGGWKTASFHLGAESSVRQWGPLPAGPVRPSGPCCLAVAKAPFVSLSGWKTASFLAGSESNVRQWGPLPAAQHPLKLPSPCCFAVEASEGNVRHWQPDDL